MIGVLFQLITCIKIIAIIVQNELFFGCVDCGRKINENPHFISGSLVLLYHVTFQGTLYYKTMYQAVKFHDGSRTSHIRNLWSRYAFSYFSDIDDLFMRLGDILMLLWDVLHLHTSNTSLYKCYCCLSCINNYSSEIFSNI